MHESWDASEPSDKTSTYELPRHTGIAQTLLETGIVCGPSNKVDNELKVWVIVREDTGMSFGKAIAQTGHAFTTAYAVTHRLNDRKAYQWLNCGQPKLSKRVKNEAKLLKAFEDCRKAGLVAILVEDAGRTEFTEKTFTVACVGPCLFEELPKSVRGLQLIKEDIVDFSDADLRLPQFAKFLMFWRRSG